MPPHTTPARHTTHLAHRGPAAGDDRLAAVAAALTATLWDLPRHHSIAAGPDTVATERIAELTDADLGRLAALRRPADADERHRLGDWLELAPDGVVLPADIEWRLWHSTHTAIHDTLRQLDDPRSADTRTGVAAVTAAVDVLCDPLRLVRSGCNVTAAGTLFGPMWRDYTARVQGRGRLLAEHRALLGADTIVDHLADAGELTCAAVPRSAAWPAAVAELRARYRARRADAVWVDPKRLPMSRCDHRFWETLERAPDRLNGAQALWVTVSRLDAIAREQRSSAHDDAAV